MGYIDPNTGGVLFQVLAAGFALISGAVLIFARQIRAGLSRLKRWFRERTGREQTQESTVNTEVVDTLSEE